MKFCCGYVVVQLVGTAMVSLALIRMAVPAYGQSSTTAPSTVPANWKPRSSIYTTTAETMVRLIGISEAQRRVVYDRLTLMTYELEQWEQNSGAEANRLRTVFEKVDGQAHAVAKKAAYDAWIAAMAPHFAIQRRHEDWIEGHVLTSEQRLGWNVFHLNAAIGGALDYVDLLTEEQRVRVRAIVRETIEAIPGTRWDEAINLARFERVCQRIKVEALTPAQADALEIRLREIGVSTTQAASQPATSRPAASE